MSHHLRRSFGALILSLGMLFLAACGSQEELDYECDGKCEGVVDTLHDKFQDYRGDVKKIKVDDLVGLGAKLITDQINNQLDDLTPTFVESSDWGTVSANADLAWAPVQIYTTADKADKFDTLSKHGDLKYLNSHNINKIRSGLMARFGDESFVTHVTNMRTKYLEEHPDEIFTESTFKLSGGLGLSLNSNKIPPFDQLEGKNVLEDLNGWVGLHANKGLEATVIAPYKAKNWDVKALSALVTAPVAAFKQMRSFFLPTETKDLFKMAPGESILLKSNGTVALNIGMGLPIHLTTIADVASLKAVLSVGASVVLGGEQVDVQIIREETDSANNIIVDVGILKPKQKSLNVALKTKWGVEGIEDIIGSYKLDLGVYELDVVDFAQKSLTKILDKHISAELNYSKSKESIRHTISRFRFNLDMVDPSDDEKDSKDQTVKQAMIQAIFGDLRLAQALSFKEGSGVTQPVGLMRNIDWESSQLGFRFLSLKFFTDQLEQQASILISKDGEDQRVSINQMKDSDGFWLTDHASTYRTMSSLTAIHGTPVDADHNLRLAVFEHDRYMKRDQILDHVDPLLAYFIGQKNFRNRLAPITDAMEAYVDTQCKPVMDTCTGESCDQLAHQKKLDKRKSCLENLAGDPEVSSSVKAARTAFKSIMAEREEQIAYLRDLVENSKGKSEAGTFIPTIHTKDANYDDELTFARKLFELKLAVQSSYQFPTPDANWLKGLIFEGPESALLVDFRMSAAALRDLFADSSRFRQALEDTLTMTHIYRTSIEAKSEGGSVWDCYDWDAIDDVMQTYTTNAKDYNMYSRLANDKETPDGKTIKVGDKAMLAIMENETPDIMTVTTIADRKAEISGEFFAEMKKSYSSGDTAEQVLAYGILACTSPKDIELSVEMSFKKTDETDHPDLNLYGVGQNIKLINTGEYNLESLFNR